MIFKDANTPNAGVRRPRRQRLRPVRPLLLDQRQQGQEPARSARPWRSPSTGRAIRLNIGGAFAGEYADGVIKPNIGVDYAPDRLLDDHVRPGDPGHRRPGVRQEADRRVRRGGPDPHLQLRRHPGQPEDRGDRHRLAGQGRDHGHAGAAAESGSYYSTVFDPTKAGDFGTGGWGADWPNASTVIPPLFTQKGGWDLSQVDDTAFNADVEAAQIELDRAKQATDVAGAEQAGDRRTSGPSRRSSASASTWPARRSGTRIAGRPTAPGRTARCTSSPS